jgi:tRNA(Ile)-lysidine synthase
MSNHQDNEVRKSAAVLMHEIEFEQRLETSWPTAQWCDSHVLLAVSGGADSVALLRAMDRLKKRCGGAGELHVAHLNHGLRGSQADDDAAWLAKLCERLGSPLGVGKADVSSRADRGDGWEEAARDARYEFLRATAHQIGDRFVATAHTADDQVETVLQRILRGTGLAGLMGMPATRNLSKSVSLVRPMLELPRAEIIEYLKALGQDYRNDASNLDVRFTRNRVRHELLPLLRESFNADVDAAILRLAQQAGESQKVIERIAREVAAECCRVDFGNNGGTNSPVDADGGMTQPPRAIGVELVCSSLRAHPTIVICEVFRQVWREANWPEQAMGYDEWRLLARMAVEHEASKAANLPGNVVARRDGDILECARLATP